MTVVAIEIRDIQRANMSRSLSALKAILGDEPALSAPDQ